MLVKRFLEMGDSNPLLMILRSALIVQRLGTVSTVLVLDDKATSPLARILLSTSPPHTKICPERIAMPGRMRPMSMLATRRHSCRGIIRGGNKII